MTLKLTESDVLIAYGHDFAEGRSVFEKLDASDGKVDGAYHPNKSRTRARGRVRAKGFDAIAEMRVEREGLDTVLRHARQTKLASVDRIARAVAAADEAIARGIDAFKFEVPTETAEYGYRNEEDLSDYRSAVTMRVMETLREVQAGRMVEQGHTPERIRKTRFERVDLRPAIKKWEAERDRRATPLQRKAYEIQISGYKAGGGWEEAERLNNEAERIMDEAKERFFGPTGFTFDDYIRSGPIQERRIEYCEDAPPPEDPTTPVQAAKAILGKAEADPRYRRTLKWYLEDSARLATLMNSVGWSQDSLTGEIALDIYALLKAEKCTNRALTEMAAQEAARFMLPGN